jgi:SpoVK/Ycf46/Vps4 family AAA+-type ATPase
LTQPATNAQHRAATSPRKSTAAVGRAADGEVDLPRGIERSRPLPDDELGALWDSIILDERLKAQLLAQAVLNFTIRTRISRVVLPLHGAILLVGPPGTGKTSLARGLAHRTAKSFSDPGFRLLEVQPHALMSSAMGKTQRAVSELFSQSVAEAASTGPTIVLLDEVETLAADRSKLSFNANPVDVHRAIDAVLVQLDILAERFSNLLFVATSNFPEAIDSAFTSRCDLVLHVPLPERDACAKILADCLVGLGRTYPAIGKLVNSPDFSSCADECVGLDGRAIRKMVANALASNQETALNPNVVTINDLLAAAKSAKASRALQGRQS